MAILVEHAPAKVNLTLAVLGRRADGYHLLDSLVVFAGAGDRLTFAPGGALSLKVRGADREAGRSGREQSRVQGREGAGGRNPRSQARPLHAGQAPAGGGGIGRRVVRCRRRRCGCWPAPTASSSTTGGCSRSRAGIGADVPVCVDPRPRRMRGIGEMLSAPLAIPKLAAVLVNPGVAVPTRDVFAMLGLQARRRAANAPRGRGRCRAAATA